MPVKFIFTIAGALLVAVFAVQNSAPADLKFLGFSATISMALIIIISACIGALSGLGLGMAKNFQSSRQVKQQTKFSEQLASKIADLERILGTKETELVHAKDLLQKSQDEAESFKGKILEMERDLDALKNQQPF